ncbi:hypothetical protein N9198_05255, partial [Akkermansiaceae bacterium]|nr:hypothetical protein [Akkermansiaceae bacterium]
MRNYKDSSAYFLLVVLLILPITFLKSIDEAVDFLAVSCFIRLIGIVLTRNKYRKLTNDLFNYAQGIFTVLIIVLWNSVYSETGVFDGSNLHGDSAAYWREVVSFTYTKDLNFATAKEDSRINYFFFQFILAVICGFFNAKFVVALLFIVFIGLVNLVILIKIGIALQYNRMIIRNIGIFYIVFPHILASNTILLKDSFITLSFLLLTYGGILFIKKTKRSKAIILILLGFFFCSVLRLPFVPLLFLILVYLVSFKRYKRVLFLGTFSYAVLVFWLNIDLFGLVTQSEKRSFGFGESGFAGTGLASVLVGSYHFDPIYLKILRLPIVVLVQYLTPINVAVLNHEIWWLYIDINLKVIWLLFFGPLYLFSIWHVKYLPIQARRI